MESGDIARIRAGFIERQLQRAQELALTASTDPGEKGRAARESAAFIVKEFRRYCEWCHDYLPEPERSHIDRTLRKVEWTIGHPQR